MLVWPCGLVRKSSFCRQGRAASHPGKLASVASSWPQHPRPEAPRRASSSWCRSLSPSFLITRRTRAPTEPSKPRSGQCFVLAPTEPMTSPRCSPGLVQTNSWRPFRKFCDAYHPSGRAGPCPGNTETPLASPVMAPPPNPSDPVFLSWEALRPRPGRALLDKIAAIEAVRPLHHGLAGPIAGRGWPW